MKVTEQSFCQELSSRIHKVVLSFESAHDILKCVNSDKTYLAELSCCAVYYPEPDDLNF